MKDKIYKIDAGISKSMVLRENEIWFSQNNVSTLDKFEKAVHKTGMLQSAYAVPLNSINEVSFNEASESVKVKYTNEKGREKKLNISFNDTNLSNEIGKYLGEKLGFTKTTTQEGQTKPLLLNVIYLLLALGATFYLGTMEDTTSLTDSGSRRSRGRMAFIKVIVDTLGQTGVFILGGLISAYLAYKLCNRFKNPTNEIVYTN